MFFKKKQKRESALKIFFIRAGAVFIFALMIILIVANIKVYMQSKNLRLEVSKYENRISQLKNQNKKLEEGIANSFNPDYIEKVAREEQDMQKEGETVVSFIMPDDDIQSKNYMTEALSVSNWFGWLQNSLNWLKEIF